MLLAKNFSGQLIDRKDVQILDAFLEHGTRHGYRAENLSARYKRGRSRHS
jgi:hypothetical protein